MTRYIFLIAILAGPVVGQDIQQLGWMSGCWEGKVRSGQVEEQWMRPAGNTMLGMSRTVAGGKTVFTEYLQIRLQEGQLVYVVQLGLADKTTTFKLVRSSETEVAFENPQHDFPQRIIYRKQPEGGLFARIEGKEKGVEKGVDFPMKRAKCD